MNVEASLYISSKNGSDFIVDSLLNFCDSEQNWSQDTTCYFDYISHKPNIDRPRVDAAIIFNGQYGVVFNNYGNPNRMNICNIVRLQQIEQISINEYNEIAKLFYTNYLRWSRANGIGVRVNISKTSFDLNEIITAEKPREAFEHYLCSPCGWGNSDKERLDRFIALYIRHARKPFPSYHIEEYLKSTLDWSESKTKELIEYVEQAISHIQNYNKNKW